MDGMFLGIATLFRDIFSEDPTTDSSIPDTTELPVFTSTLPLTTYPVTNATNETLVVLIVEPEDEVRKLSPFLQDRSGQRLKFLFFLDALYHCHWSGRYRLTRPYLHRPIRPVLPAPKVLQMRLRSALLFELW